jgi:hypothetical protein
LEIISEDLLASYFKGIFSVTLVLYAFYLLTITEFFEALFEVEISVLLIAKVALFKVELDAISNLLMFTKYC